MMRLFRTLVSAIGMVVVVATQTSAGDPAGAIGRVAAPLGGVPAAKSGAPPTQAIAVTADHRPDQWRYRWANNHWWYWTPQNRWIVYNDRDGWVYWSRRIKFNRKPASDQYSTSGTARWVQ